MFGTDLRPAAMLIPTWYCPGPKPIPARCGSRLDSAALADLAHCETVNLTILWTPKQQVLLLRPGGNPQVRAVPSYLKNGVGEGKYYPTMAPHGRLVV
jgi:hypothetical protein